MFASSRGLSLAAALLAAALTNASAQVLYKWTDAQGKVQYSDRPPKNFQGEVQRLEPPEPPVATPPPVVPPKSSTPLPDVAAKPAPPKDLATERRAVRTQLETRLRRARADFEAAKKALADAESPDPDERQVIQQRGKVGGQHGMAARSNCRAEVGKDGRKVMMCPTAVPTPEYYDRVARLETALKQAEEELAAAEQAWRRGVD